MDIEFNLTKEYVSFRIDCPSCSEKYSVESVIKSNDVIKGFANNFESLDETVEFAKCPHCGAQIKYTIKALILLNAKKDPPKKKGFFSRLFKKKK